jgi:hypothetical protein
MRPLIVVTTVAACFLTTGVLAQQEKSPAVRGVWKLSRLVISADEPGPKADGLLLLTERHYSLINIQGDRPIPEAGRAVSDAEKITLYDTLASNAGTYELSGKTITMHVQFAKNQSVVGRTITADIEVRGRTLDWVFTKGPGEGGRATFERVEP